MEIQYLGNKELLKLHKTAFLASNTIPIEMVLKCYDWASGKHEGCVISGFSSKLEKDVLHFLLKSNLLFSSWQGKCIRLFLMS